MAARRLEPFCQSCGHARGDGATHSTQLTVGFHQETALICNCRANSRPAPGHFSAPVNTHLSKRRNLVNQGLNLKPVRFTAG